MICCIRKFEIAIRTSGSNVPYGDLLVRSAYDGCSAVVVEEECPCCTKYRVGPLSEVTVRRSCDVGTIPVDADYAVSN